MNFEYSYLVVVGLILLLCMFYFSPYELKVKQDDDDE